MSASISLHGSKLRSHLLEPLPCNASTRPQALNAKIIANQIAFNIAHLCQSLYINPWCMAGKACSLWYPILSGSCMCAIRPGYFTYKIYRKFSNKGATPYRGPHFWTQAYWQWSSNCRSCRTCRTFAPLVRWPLLGFWTFLAISQPLEGEIALSIMGAPPKGSPIRPAPLLGNLR